MQKDLTLYQKLEINTTMAKVSKGMFKLYRKEIDLISYVNLLNLT